MTVREKFEGLVRELEGEQLEELRKCVASEIGGRSQKSGFRIEDIHPRMTGEERERAAQDSARILGADSGSHSGR
jgi:hypothetical protein